MSNGEEMISLTDAVGRGYACRPTLLKAIFEDRLPAEKVLVGRSERQWRYMVRVDDLERCFDPSTRGMSGRPPAVPTPLRFERMARYMTVEEIDAFIDILEQQKAFKLANLTRRQARKVKEEIDR